MQLSPVLAVNFSSAHIKVCCTDKPSLCRMHLELSGPWSLGVGDGKVGIAGTHIACVSRGTLQKTA